jgi:hypothetical protein
MIHLSLDAEPPPKFNGKKEVNKRKNGTLSKVVKNLEKQLILNRKENDFEIGYLINERNFSEDNLTLTKKTIEFTNANISSNRFILNSYYKQKQNTLDITRKDFPKFYNVTTSYSFMPQIKQEDKKEDSSQSTTQSKEQETKEISPIIYNLYNFEEEKKQEN